MQPSWKSVTFGSFFSPSCSNTTIDMISRWGLVDLNHHCPFCFILWDWAGGQVGRTWSYRYLRPSPPLGQFAKARYVWYRWLSHDNNFPTILNRNWESRYFFVKIDENSVPELIVLVLRVICSIGILSLNDIDWNRDGATCDWQI